MIHSEGKHDLWEVLPESEGPISFGGGKRITGEGIGHGGSNRDGNVDLQ